MSLHTVIIVCLISSILLFVMTVRRWRKTRWLGRSVNTSLTLILGGISTLLLLIASNLHSYQRLSYEQAIASASITELGHQRYQLRLKITDQPSTTYEIYGDDWQIDARVLKWHSYANLIGLNLVYKLERLSGRYTNIEQERSAQRSVHALHDTPQLDIWQFARRYPEWLPFVDAVYGSASYVPLRDQAEYAVFASQSGILIRPDNDVASETISGWR